MCGIIGYVGHADGLSRERFAGALAGLRHRGPDDEGLYEELLGEAGALVLGHRRLAILDLSPLGHEPMTSPRTGTVLVYNGEVYNFREIRAELEERGYALRSDCDAEVVLAAWDEWGAACVQRFNGMFAFAIWDPRSRKLTLARDRIGIKPLYWFDDGTCLAFGSELTALTALGIAAPELRPDALADYFALGYLPWTLTALRRYSKLRPAHLLEYDVDARRVSIRRYWNALDAWTAPEWDDPEEALAERLEALLLDAVEKRLVSDVPLGAFLSGGIDSSLVVSLMSRASASTVKSFTIGFPVPEMNEAPHARRVASHLGTEHHELYVTPEGLTDALVRAASIYDEPFADSSAIPTVILSELTRKHVTVALSGDGGDELYWGYARYRKAGAYRHLFRMPRAARLALASMLRGVPHARPKLWAYVLESPNVAQMYARVASHRVADLVPPDAETLGRDRTAAEVWERIGGRPWEKVPTATDALGYLPEDLLTKVDRASMSVGLEVRVPLLDHRFVEFSARVPHRFKRRGSTTKHLLRKVLERYVPRAAWERPKSGFGIPLGLWFRGELREWVMDELSGTGWTLGAIDAARARELIDEHMRGGADHSPLIWAFLSWKSWATRVGLCST